MGKRKRPVRHDRLVVDYDSDDPLAAFAKKRKIKRTGPKQASLAPSFREPIREELVSLKWTEQFWSRKYKKTQLNMFLTKHQQLQSYIFKGYGFLAEQSKGTVYLLRNHFHQIITTLPTALNEIFDCAVGRINKVKEKFGEKFDTKFTFQMYQQICHSRRKKRITIEDHSLSSQDASSWLRLGYSRVFTTSSQNRIYFINRMKVWRCLKSQNPKYEMP